jgi:hypothetical protein
MNTRPVSPARAPAAGDAADRIGLAHADGEMESARQIGRRSPRGNSTRRSPPSAARRQLRDRREGSRTDQVEMAQDLVRHRLRQKLKEDRVVVRLPQRLARLGERTHHDLVR